jgi:hypothetical protein
LIAIQWKSFRLISARMRDLQESDTALQHALWCLGAVLFAHAITFLSISYFDQIYVFFWGLLGGLTGFLTPPKDDRCRDGGDAAGLVTGDAAENPAWPHQHETRYTDFRASAR